MAYTTIDDPTQYFNTVLWTGDGTDDRNITGVGFQPDMVWEKKRNEAGSHRIADSVRGATNVLFPDLSNAEASRPNEFQAFISDGFQIGSDSNFNQSSNTHVGWSWLASNTTASNTDGDITSTVSANTTAGFSIVSWTGNGTAGQTIGHGLGAVPNIIITKGRSSALNWFLFDSMSSYLKRLKLNTTDAQADTDGLNDTAPTSSLFTVSGGGEGNTSGVTYIGYLFAEKKGYSKFGNYTGNGGSSGVNNADGTFVYTGFKPAWIMIKRTDSAQQWGIADSKRDVDNPVQHHLFAESNQADSASSYNNFDFLSNGFKLRSGDQWTNASGGTYIYMAFAESPFVSSGGIPTTAR